MKYYNLFLSRHKLFWTREHVLNLVKMFGLFVIALIVQHFASKYVVQVTGTPVGDLILSHIPTLDIDIFVVQGALLLTFLILGLLIWKPKYLIFTLAAYSIFVITRAFFISLTHLGVDPHEIVLDTQSIGFGLYNILYNTKSDFFFSGHTGTPFLMGLIFMHERFWGKFFFFMSLFFGVSVLLGHIHYSIDVFAAPFMAYGIFTIAKWLFPKEYAETKPH